MSTGWSKIARRHYQGGFPPAGPVLQKEGFDVLVLCALPAEYEKHFHLAWYGLDYDRIESLFPGIEIMRAPNEDDYDRPLTLPEIQIACSAADHVNHAIRAQKRVLVTCAKGRNRSGLVSALSLANRFGYGGLHATYVVRKRRQPDCDHKVLENPRFVHLLATISPKLFSNASSP